MPIEIQPATEADAARLAAIEGLAFAHLPSNAVLFPGPFPAASESNDKPSSTRAGQLATLIRESATARLFKAVDTEILKTQRQASQQQADSETAQSQDYKQTPSSHGGLGNTSSDGLRSTTGALEQDAIVGWCMWHVYVPSMPRSVPRIWGPGYNAEACALLFEGMEAKRAETMGDKPYVYLQVLVIEPTHQRRGIGAQLMAWGVQEAATRKIQSYLESSEEAHRLYQRFGFHDMERIETDFSKWGVKEPQVTFLMMREAEGEAGIGG